MQIYQNEKEINHINKHGRKRFILAKKLLLAFLILLVLALIVGVILLAIQFSAQLSFILLILHVLAIICVIPIVNSKMNSAYKIAWLSFMVIVPIIGMLCYLLFANKKFTKKEEKMLAPTFKSLAEANRIGNYSKTLFTLDTKKYPDLYNIGLYLKKYGGIDLFTNSEVDYYPWGEDAYPHILEALKEAKHYIFLEYFIIQPGKMWNSMLDILLTKAKEGVDVRILYDDLGCIGTLPIDYPAKLAKYGIKAYKYEPIKPVISARLNNRDHRKILVIDGHTGFTGGINLADEYINEIVRFGKWKDNCIRIKGEAVFGLTSLFLSTWAMVTHSTARESYEKYLPHIYKDETEPLNLNKAKGFIQPYGCLPYTFETVGFHVYEMLANRANKYLYIATPYLILNEEMVNMLSQAAKNGVDVKLLTPHIPDKKAVFQLTRRNYRQLLEAGVTIYEYTPGFVHEKVFLVDDIMGTVGTINLDYRSLYLHCENGVFMYNTPCLKDIKKDFEETFKVSQEYTFEMMKKEKWYIKLFQFILQLIAPLL